MIRLITASEPGEDKLIGGDEIIGVNSFLWALISACVLLVLLAAYCDAIDLVLDLAERTRLRLAYGRYSRRNFDIALDHERTCRDSA